MQLQEDAPVGRPSSLDGITSTLDFTQENQALNSLIIPQQKAEKAAQHQKTIHTVIQSSLRTNMLSWEKGEKREVSFKEGRDVIRTLNFIP
jgi:hypothetical protein